MGIMHIHAFAPTNFFKAYDPFFLPIETKPWVMNLSAHVEAGQTCRASNGCGEHCNILRMYNNQEAVIPMLRNPSPLVAERGADNLLKTLRRLPGGSVTGLTRGQVQFSGKFQQIEGALHGCYSWESPQVPGYFSLSVHQAFLEKKVDDICIKDLTPDNYCADAIVKKFITELSEKTKEIGCLDICNWSSAGIGDLTLLLEWRKRFEGLDTRTDQTVIKNVTLYTRAGCLFPLATEKNENIAFSMPLGSDGHWGLPLGFGLEIDFIKYISINLYADLLILFDKDRNRRIKTHVTQTDFLLMNTAWTNKRQGMTWQLEAQAVWRYMPYNLSTMLGYLYMKHHNDELFLQNLECNSCLSNDIINTAENLKEWHSHNIFIQIAQTYPNCYCTPLTVSLFGKFPIGGERVIECYTFGTKFEVKF